jgi:hypothetical protein
MENVLSDADLYIWEVSAPSNYRSEVKVFRKRVFLLQLCLPFCHEGCLPYLGVEVSAFPPHEGTGTEAVS